MSSAAHHLSNTAHAAGTAAFHALPEHVQHNIKVGTHNIKQGVHNAHKMVSKAAHTAYKVSKQIAYDIAIGVFVLLLVILIIVLFSVSFQKSITKTNITATGNLTVNGTLTAKSTSTETTFYNITCDDVTASGTVIASGTVNAGGMNASGNITGGGLIISGQIDCGANLCVGSDNVIVLYESDGSISCNSISMNYIVTASEATTTMPADTYISSISQSGLNISIVAPAGGYVYSQNGLILTGTGTGSGTLSCASVTANGVALTSDYRLKEEIQPISDSCAIDSSIDKLKPCSYVLKDDESKKLQTGFIAHELQEIFPHLVNGEKDGEKMQSVNYIGLIAILTKELQSLKSVMVELKADNNILKSDNIELKADITILKAENIELKDRILNLENGHI